MSKIFSEWFTVNIFMIVTYFIYDFTILCSIVTWHLVYLSLKFVLVNWFVVH